MKDMAIAAKSELLLRYREDIKESDGGGIEVRRR